MGRLCPGLLEIAANPLELSMLMSKFSAGCEVRRTGSGDVDDAEVNAENCPVLVVILYLDLFFGLVSAKPEVEIMFAIAL